MSNVNTSLLSHEKTINSWSALKTYLYGCEEEFRQRYVNNRQSETMGQDQTTTSEMAFGRVMHHAFEMGYKSAGCNNANLFAAAAENALKTFGDSLEAADLTLMSDILYFFVKHGYNRDNGSDVITADTQMIVTNEDDFTMTFSPDLVLQTPKGILIRDHKFVGALPYSLEAAAYDFQRRAYPALLQQMYPDDAIFFEFAYYRKAVPPGFGSRSEFTPTGRLSTASKDPNDYLEFYGPIWTPKEDNDEFFAYLQEVKAKAVAGPWKRRMSYGCDKCWFKTECWNLKGSFNGK